MIGCSQQSGYMKAFVFALDWLDHCRNVPGGPQQGPSGLALIGYFGVPSQAARSLRLAEAPGLVAS